MMIHFPKQIKTVRKTQESNIIKTNIFYNVHTNTMNIYTQKAADDSQSK